MYAGDTVQILYHITQPDATEDAAGFIRIVLEIYATY